MSKDITIQEGGTARTFTGVEKLKTAQVGGGNVIWVPEDERQLGHKSINADGTYYASADGYYGFEYVVVNGIKGNDADGDPAIVTVDPETEDLTEKKIPHHIEIVTPPTKTIYTEGETMDYTGIAVQLRTKDDTAFTDDRYTTGDVPTEELIFPVSEAPAPEGGGQQARSELIDFPISICEPTIGNYVYPAGALTTYGNGAFLLYITASKTQDTFTIQPKEGSSGQPQTLTRSQSYTHDGKTAYYYNDNWNISWPHDGVISGESGEGGKLAWTMLYGTISGGEQEIPVQWTCPYSGSEHQDTFEIRVVDAAV